MNLDCIQLAKDIKEWGKQLGFRDVGITDTELPQAEARLKAWLARQHHGTMHYMEKHGLKRSRPTLLEPWARSIVIVCLDYYTPYTSFISRYALGRDYHRLMRKRLTQLAARVEERIGPFRYRAFSDSAPVMEKPLAEKAGLGWIGKNTLLIHRQAGSWFFLGALFTDLPLPPDQTATNHCGSCSACLDVCPTKAIVAPYQLDARRCISYLTIENKGPIPEAFRKAIGHRIFGCDDCQLICPWNKFAKVTKEIAFHPRFQNHLDINNKTLIEFFLWEEADFLRFTEGSALRRAGFEGWLRNVAIALGNADHDPAIIAALKTRENHHSELVREHVRWALSAQNPKSIDPY